MSRFVAVIAMALSAAVAAAQPIYPLQQERDVLVRIEGTYDPNDPYNPYGIFELSDAAAGFETWQADICAERPDQPPTASTLQYSAITAATIDAYCSADMAIAGYPEFERSYLSTAQNHFRLRFAVPARTTLDMVGALSLEGMGMDISWWCDWMLSLWAMVEVRQIAGPTVYTDYVNIAMNDDTWSDDLIVDTPIAFAVELAPGVYELEVTAQLDGQLMRQDYWFPDSVSIAAEGTYMVSAEFTPVPVEDPAKADLDGDGDVDFADYARFQRAFTGPALGPQ